MPRIRSLAVVLPLLLAARHRDRIADAGTLVPAGDQPLAASLVDDYIPLVLRAPDSWPRRDCTASR